MPVIVVANPKGGVGKSTLATNIAGLFARQGRAVMLGDVDRQQSSRQWLALRPDAAPRIQSWDLVGDSTLKTPKGVTHVVAAADTFQRLGENTLGDSGFATPAAAGGQLFVRSGDRLYCIGR